MNIAIVTLFPEMFAAITEYGITARALKNKLVNVSYFNPREFTTDKHQTVDDRPYGGGPGMVMKVEPLKKALFAARQWHKTQQSTAAKETVIFLSPQGRKFNHTSPSHFIEHGDITFVAGRYEGVDQRFIDAFVDEQWSIGDFVLSGGELPAMVMLDAIIRKLPGALGDAESFVQDSFENGLLDYPHYTRPENLSDNLGAAELTPFLKVPGVLLGGNHKAITQWREEQSLAATAHKRPDLLESYNQADNEKK